MPSVYVVGYVFERELPFVDLETSEEGQRFEDFLVFAMKEMYKKYLSGVVNINYRGLPGILFYVDDEQGPLLEIVVTYSSNSVRYRVAPLRPRVKFTVVERAASVLERTLLLFAETGGVGTAYFVFVPGREIVPPRVESKARRAVQALMLGNLVLLFAISMVISYTVFVLFEEYTPLVLILSQIPFLFLSYKIVAHSMGDWKIDEKHQDAHLIGIRMPFSKYQEAMQNIFLPKRYEIKRQLYTISLEREEEPSAELVKSVLARYGLPPEDCEVEIRKVNLYKKLRDLASRLGVKRLPAMYIWNVVIPNAAAAGLTWSLSTLVVTTGLIARLSEDELEAVLGHELSHIKRHDVLTIFILSSFEFLTRFYLAMFLWPLFITFFGIVYLWLSLTAFFIAAKFLEARADMEAALITGRPEKLASALKKIGYRRFLLEAGGERRLEAWLTPGFHPPLTFRYEKMLEMASKKKVKGIWREAITSCIADLINSLKLRLAA